jgi:hypothetical protein
LQAKETRLTEAHDIVLQDRTFTQETSERKSSQDFKTDLQTLIDGAKASRQALGFENDEKTINQRAKLDKELTRLNSQLRIVESEVDMNEQLKVLGVKDGYELFQMDKGHAQNMAVIDHKGAINAEAAKLSQIATSVENALNRAATEGLQVNAQNFRMLLQNDMQAFSGNEKEKDRLLTVTENVLDRVERKDLQMSAQDFKLLIQNNLQDFQGSESEKTRLLTISENLLDRAAREGLQLTAQGFKELMQKDLLAFKGSEGDKNRLLEQVQNDVMNALKERGLDFNDRSLNIDIIKNAAAQSLALRKQTFVEAEAAADRLVPSFKVVDNDLVMVKQDGTAVSVFTAPPVPPKPLFKTIRNMSNQTTRVIDASTPAGLLAIEQANLANSGGTEAFKVSNMSADSAPTAKAFKINNLGIVLSYDGGRTYTAADGSSASMPNTGVQPLSDTIAASEAAKMRIQLSAGRDLAEMDDMLGLISMGGTRENPVPLSSLDAGLMRDAMDAARGGTGPYAGFAVALDNVFGGLIPQARKAFQKTQANKQFLRGVTILTRSALVVNPRFPVAEMEKVAVLFADPDKFFANPETEANKFVELKRLALSQRRANLQALNEGVQDDKTRQAVMSNNFEIDRLLGMLSTVPTSTGGNVDTDTMDALRNHILNK